MQVMSSKMTLGGDVDFSLIAKKTPGFVGADLSSLTKEAAVVAINRIFTRLRASPSPPASTDGGSAGRSSNSETSAANVIGKLLRVSLSETLRPGLQQRCQPIYMFEGPQTRVLPSRGGGYQYRVLCLRLLTRLYLVHSMRVLCLTRKKK